ncbi:MAG: hypothetical protein IT341_06875 [Chloroflexi bacterium]|nr:hypothetical protein [Chloroflexota bacterium]
MAIHDVIEALLVGARDALDDDLRPTEPGPVKVVTLAPQDADVLLRIIEATWEALCAGHVTGASCDQLDRAFEDLAAAASGPVTQCKQDTLPTTAPLAVVR